jgi:hypothetical protein
MVMRVWIVKTSLNVRFLKVVPVKWTMDIFGY